MAFAHVGSLGTANSKTSTTTVALTTSQDAPVGSLVIVIAAWDNSDTADIDGLRHYVTDSAGNFYTYLGQWVNANGAAAAGAEAMIYGSVIETDLASGQTITVTSITARTAKAVSAELFSLGSPWFALAGKAELSTDAADPGAISLSGMPSREYLFLHCLASEGPSTDTYTWDSDYTQFASDGTTGGVADTNMQVCGGFRIATLTGDTVDVTSLTADRDYSQVFVAIREYTPSATPSAPLKDDFTRANESPLAAPYQKVDGSGVALVSNAVGIGVAAAVAKGSFLDGYLNDLETFITATTLPAAGLGNQLGVGAHFSSTGGATWNGYAVPMETRSGLPNTVYLRYVTGGLTGSDITYAKMAVQWRTSFAAGDLLGIKTSDTTVEAWIKTSGTWRMMAAVDDATVRNGRIGMLIKDGGTTGRLDDLHAAAILPFISSVTALYSLALVGAIPVPFISSATTVYTPALQGVLPVPFIASTTAVYTPTLTSAALDVPFIASTTVVYTPALSGPLNVPFISSHTHVWAISSLFDPNKVYGGPGNGGEAFLVELNANGVTTSATLAADIGVGNGTVTLTGDSGFPTTVAFVVTIDSEQLYLFPRGGGSYSCHGRGMGNTTPAAHSAGASADWGDSYDQAIVAAGDIGHEFTADINSTGSFTYPGWLICFDASQAYLSGDRYPMHVTEVVGVFDAGAGVGGTNRCDGSQPNAVCAPATVSDYCPAALSNPARIESDISTGDVAVVRYTNPEATALDLGPRAVTLQSWFGLMRVDTTNHDVTFTDPNGIVVDTTGTYDTFTGSINGVFAEPLPLQTGIAPDASDTAGHAVPTPNTVPWETVTLPGTDRKFTYGSGGGGYDEKGWPICCLAVRNGKKRVPYWQSWDWRDYSYIYTGFGTDALYAQLLINRNGIVFDSVPAVSLPGPQDIDGPDVVWDDANYFYGCSWYVVIFNAPYIVYGPSIGGSSPPGSGGPGAPPGYAPGVTFPPGGPPVVLPPPIIEGGSGGNINPDVFGLHVWGTSGKGFS